jgi:BirA family biotin operon repressor/biotin-[acetyl-CoA-carboxylase] ligase
MGHELPSGLESLRAVSHAWWGLPARDGAARASLVLATVTDSTQRWARALLEASLAEEDEPDPYCCGALEQTAGRGRDRRTWSSRPGGVYATLVSRLADESELQSLPSRAAVALAGLVNPILGGRCRIKWPNDLVVDRKKLGGILIDAVTPADSAPWALVGFGVNHSQRDFEAAGEVATSLAAEVGLKLPFFEEFFAAAIAAVASVAVPREPAGAGEAEPAGATGDWLRHLRELSAHEVGDSIRAQLGERTVEGRFAGFDDHGFLLLEGAAGREVIRSGEVFAW